VRGIDRAKTGRNGKRKGEGKEEEEEDDKDKMERQEEEEKEEEEEEEKEEKEEEEEKKIHRFRRTVRRVPRVEDPWTPLPDSTSRQINPPPTTTRYGQCARDGASSFVLFAQASSARPDLLQVLEAGMSLDLERSSAEIHNAAKAFGNNTVPEVPSIWPQAPVLEITLLLRNMKVNYNGTRIDQVLSLETQQFSDLYGVVSPRAVQ
ncbi:hypothetical protein V1477_014791, partial [Vespula maculifrons]